MCSCSSPRTSYCAFVRGEDPVEDLEVQHHTSESLHLKREKESKLLTWWHLWIWSQGSNSDKGSKGDGTVGVSVVLRESETSAKVQPAHQSLLALGSKSLSRGVASLTQSLTISKRTSHLEDDVFEVRICCKGVPHKVLTAIPTYLDYRCVKHRLTIPSGGFHSSTGYPHRLGGGSFLQKRSILVCCLPDQYQKEKMAKETTKSPFRRRISWNSSSGWLKAIEKFAIAIP